MHRIRTHDLRDTNTVTAPLEPMTSYPDNLVSFSSKGSSSSLSIDLPVVADVVVAAVVAGDAVVAVVAAVVGVGVAAAVVGVVAGDRLMQRGFEEQKTETGFVPKRPWCKKVKCLSTKKSLKLCRFFAFAQSKSKSNSKPKSRMLTQELIKYILTSFFGTNLTTVSKKPLSLFSLQPSTEDQGVT